MPDPNTTPPVILVLPHADEMAVWRSRLPAGLRPRVLAMTPVADWRKELAPLRRAYPGAWLLRIRTRGLWAADDALARLLAAARTCAGPLAAMSNSSPGLSPAAPDTTLAAPAVAIDAAVAALGYGQPLAIDDCDPPLWALAADGDPGAALSVSDQIYVHHPERPIVGLMTPPDRREREPAHPLASLRRALHQSPPTDPADWPAAGRDRRPVVLHLLHGWGGGAERWVRDLADADPARHHLLLRALGHPGRARHGEWLELSSARSGARLGRWRMLPGIGAMADRHAAYRECLHAIIGRYAVETLLVSSLIGHSLEALRSGLPTLWIAHDAFPFWPALHRDFGDPEARFDEVELTRDLKSPGLPFRERDSGHWQALRAATIDALSRANGQLVAPSRAALAQVQRVATGWRPQAIHIIPHGIRPWPEASPVVPAAGRPLRIVVLGRINGAKGEDLLATLIPLLDERVELYLLGGGKAAERFFGCAGVHIVLDYVHAELPQALARIAPDAALLPATVSETFSYTLSELWSLAIPPIATRLGAVAERIEDGRNGLLLAPDAQAIAQRLRALAEDRAPLDAIRAQLGAQAPRTVSEMARDYDALLPGGTRPAPRGQPMAVAATDRAVADDALTDAELLLAKLSARAEEQEAELARRADWAYGLDQLVQERTRWAKALDAELGEARALIARREQEYTGTVAALEAARSAALAEADRLNKELERTMEEQRLYAAELIARAAALEAAVREREHAIAERDGRLKQLADEIHELGAERARLDGELAALAADKRRIEAERNAIEAHRLEILTSTSWRLTAPLRAVGTLLKRVRAALAFRLRRLRSLIGRTRGSLKRRGVVGTIQRARQELAESGKAPPVPTAVETPVPMSEYQPFLLATSETPLVSVIVPVYNQLHHTWNCLKALAEHAGPTPFEVIVVDDGSSDATATEVPRIGGVRFHKNPENLGFIGACNAGAALARGQYLFFLNNDTAVQPGWLEPLVDTFTTFERVGLVGSKLIYPDGRLQEAGGIVFKDGSGWNYGRFDHPDDPRYDYPREVDYCSGAAILIEKALFDSFGGFDTLYKPAYYEDTDLAFKVRAAGLRVIYQPASKVIHFEGVTGGTDTSSGTKRYQVINQGKFLDRWREALASQPEPTDHAGIWRAATHRAQGRILLIDATTPTPDQDSGSVRYINLIRVLRALGWQCTFFADNRAWIERYTEELRALGVEVQFHPWLSDPVAFFRERGAQFDAVMVSRHYVASHYVDLVRQYAPQARLLFDTVDLHYLREQRAAAVAGSEAMARQAEATRNAELDLIRRSDITLVVSPVEQALLAQEVPGARVEVLSNVHEVAGRKAGFEVRKDLWFVGGFQHTPNVDAVEWFVREIWPRVHAELPEAVFHVVGSKMPESLATLKIDGVKLHGFVEDLTPFLDGCRLSVAPLRFGAGVKGKVNQSMAHGQPVVATPIAVEGMAIEAGREALVAETPQDFAGAVVRLYRDPQLWLALSDAGLANIEAHFSFAAAARALQRVLRG
jgi:GT2 family glycosyltransferase/glycosyltransferase involved in cell wall biosynthesis